MRASTMPSVAIIGTGFGGLGMAIQLKKAGITDLTIFEKAADVGGVWRENDYPGAACDVPSHLYSFSFAPKSDWSRRFAPQAEIYQYLRDSADKYDVRKHVRFQTEVRGSEFDERAGEWVIYLADGSTHRANVLITATGQLSRPAVPRIPGIDSFEGEIFHSATWNHDYELEGKKVAVIGTGASAIQFIPTVAEKSAHMKLFQRDAAYVIPKPDYDYSKSANALFKHVPGLLKLSRWATYAELEPRAAAFGDLQFLMKPFQWKFRSFLAQEIKDPELRAKLTPKDPMGCKRILMSNDYYRALARPNVDVVTDGIVEIRPEGLVTADGTLHAVDAIVLGTGFAATDFLSPMQVTGLDGAGLNDVWQEGAEAHLGMTVSGFPNFFMLYGPNTNLSHNSIVFMLESQIAYVRQAIEKLAEENLKWLDVRPDVQSEFNTRIQRKLADSVWAQGCKSWYTHASGKNTQNWPGFTFSYRAATRVLDSSDFVAQPKTALVLVNA
ncbi:flavin-containing monooxygenase [Smaragdicoccus niigatensis]|uniref:flavin-containing monooxygenase n=1 Tax=Smaragdicoccus niigatensis TaxID=359359 RepID=UPI00037963C7|nr:NAD(P)/FAD-dependent oxidoreductase [Smaragdicoccus niigatensis]